jgi:hypothetical protein
MAKIANHVMSERPHNAPKSPLSVMESELATRCIEVLERATGGSVLNRETRQALGIQAERRPAEILTLEAAGLQVDVAIVFLRQAYPRDIRNAMWALAAFRNTPPGSVRPVIPMVAAQSLSPGAKDVLRDTNVAFFDLQGSLYLKWNHWLINIEQTVTRSTSKEAAGEMDLFTDARACVAHTLLHYSHDWINVGFLAQQSSTSTYTCSTVLQELERREWCTSEGRGPGLRRRLVKPNALLDAWANAWQSRQDERTRWYIFSQQPADLIPLLAGRLSHLNPPFPWAFTGTTPANAYAPLLTSVAGAELIVPNGQGDLLAKDMKLAPVEKGSNVTIVERDSASLLFRQQQPDGSWFASPFVLYLDLLNGRGRNKELALNVREKLDLQTDGT